jgi:thiol-disulfide isomerase/thioredoxin
VRWCLRVFSGWGDGFRVILCGLGRCRALCLGMMKRLFGIMMVVVCWVMPLQGQMSNASVARQQAAMQKLFGGNLEVEDLGKALQEAAAAGVPEQTLLEAQLIWGLRNQQLAFLQTLMPELEVLMGTFDPGLSAGFKSVDELKGLVSYVKALQARADGDEKALEAHIKEAFWLNPGQAALYAQVIEEMRREKKMANFRLDLDVVLTTSQGEATTLRDELGEGKALLIDFWASWCGPCMALMPELRKKGQALGAHGIVVVGMNTDSENAEEVADKVRREKDMTLPWLVEPGDRPYSTALEIRSIPSMVLVTPEGRVLYFGHPQSPDLMKALKEVAPEVEVGG